MKNALLFSLCLLGLTPVFSQSNQPPYKVNKNLPSFDLEQVNNTKINTASLKKNVPTIIMFFSPTCDHCIHQFEDMQKRMKDLKPYQVVMATYQPLDELAEFNKKYQIAKHPNIITGRDVNFFLPPFFDIHNFPYFAFYDKAGKLKSTFEGNMPVDDIIKRMK